MFPNMAVIATILAGKIGDAADCVARLHVDHNLMRQCREGRRVFSVPERARISVNGGRASISSLS